jgi:hypothetical protein
VSTPVDPIRTRLVEPPEPAARIARRRRLEREDERQSDEHTGPDEERRGPEDDAPEGHVDVRA